MDKEHSIKDFLSKNITEAFPNRTELQKKICKILFDKGDLSIRGMVISRDLPCYNYSFKDSERKEIAKVLNPYKLRLGMYTEQLDAYIMCQSENPDSRLFLDIENHGFKCSQFTSQTLRSYNILYWIDLLIYTEDDLLSFRGIGTKTVDEIKEGVASCGFNLGMTLDDIRDYCRNELNITNVIDQCKKRIEILKTSLCKEEILLKELHSLLNSELEPIAEREKIRKLLKENK